MKNTKFDFKSINKDLTLTTFIKLLKLLPKYDKLYYCKYRGIILDKKEIQEIPVVDYPTNFLIYMNAIEDNLNNMSIYYYKLYYSKHFSEKEALQEIKKHMIESSLRFRFNNYKLKEICFAVKQIPKKYRDIIIERYGNNLLELHKLSNEDSYELLKTAHEEIKNILVKEEIHPLSPRRRYCDQTLEELKEYIKKLPENYQKVIYLRHGENLNKYLLFSENSYYSLYDDAIIKLDIIINKVRSEIHSKSLRAKYPDKNIEELKMYVDKLPENYQRIIYIRNGDNLNKWLPFPKEKNYNSCYYTYEKAIISLDDIIMQNIHPKSLRGKYPDKTLEELKEYIKKLPENYQKIIYIRNGENLDKWISFPKDKPYQNYYNLYTRAITELDDLINGRISETHPKSIRAKYPDKTLEELKEYIEKLPVNYQKIIYMRNGDNLDKWLPFPKDKSYQSYYYLYSKAEAELDNIINGINIAFKEEKTIINSYKREDLLYAIPRLLLEDQNLVYFVHGKNLDQNNSLPENPPEKAPNYFYQKYVRLFSKIDAILFKRSEIRKNNDFIKNKLGDYTFEEVVEALKELPEEMSNVIIIKHGKNLDEYNPWPNNKPFNYYKRLYNEAIFTLKTILKKKKYPEIYEQEQKHITKLVEERKQENQKMTKKKRRKTELVIKMFKKEDIIWASEFLSKLQKEILYLRHGENLDRTISWPPIPEGKRANYYSSNYNNMKIRLKYIIEHKSEFIKSLDNKENKKSLSVSIKSKTKVRNVENSIINTVPHDKLLKYAPMLPKTQKEIFYLRHGENLDQVLVWPEIPEGKSSTYYHTNYSFACKNIYKMIEKEEGLTESLKSILISCKSKSSYSKKVRNTDNPIINIIPHDKLLKYAPMLSKIQKEIFYLRHGENLDQVLA